MLALLIPGVGMGGGGVATATVPAIVGETQAQADADIVAAGFVAALDSSLYSPTVAAGLVISQYPGPGTTHDLASTVSYVLSLGPKPLVSVGESKLYRRYRGYDAVVQRGDRKPRR